MAQNLAVQPNFTTAAQSMRVTADEIEKCSNLPAISEGTAIINAIQALSTKIEAVEARLSTKIEAVEARLSTKIEATEARLSAQVQTLSARVLAAEHNATARLQNSLLRLSSAPLMVLHDIGNNPIEPFPGTPAAMQQLRGAQIDDILHALNMPITGTNEQKRSRLRVVVGIRTEGIIA